MPSFIHELDSATGKRKRGSSGLDEKNLDREVQMKIAAASAYTSTQPHNFPPNTSPFPRQMLASRLQRTPGSKRRFLLSPKESVAFPPTHSRLISNTVTSLNRSLDAYSDNAPLYASPQRVRDFSLSCTLDRLEEGIRMINQEIQQSEARTTGPQAQTAVKGTGKINLEPCHICMRRPRQRQNLDCCADCEGCGKRCCWICVRQCAGAMQFWDGALGTETPIEEESGDQEMGHSDGDGDGDGDGANKGGEGLNGERKGSWPAAGGHKTMICAACCVERGGEGEVRCLACLRAEEAG